MGLGEVDAFCLLETFSLLNESAEIISYPWMSYELESLFFSSKLQGYK